MKSDNEELSKSKKKDQSADLKQLLMQKINGNQAKPFHFNISKTIQVDSFVLNFGTFYPEKLLGSILLVQNITDSD